MKERDYSHLSKGGQQRMARMEAKVNERFLASQLKISSDSSLMRAAKDYTKLSKFGNGDGKIHTDSARLGTVKLTADMDREIVASQMADAMVDRGMADRAKMYFPDQKKRIDTRSATKTVKTMFGWLWRAW